MRQSCQFDELPRISSSSFIACEQEKSEIFVLPQFDARRHEKIFTYAICINEPNNNYSVGETDCGDWTSFYFFIFHFLTRFAFVDCFVYRLRINFYYMHGKNADRKFYSPIACFFFSPYLVQRLEVNRKKRANTIWKIIMQVFLLDELSLLMRTLAAVAQNRIYARECTATLTTFTHTQSDLAIICVFSLPPFLNI